MAIGLDGIQESTVLRRRGVVGSATVGTYEVLANVDGAAVALDERAAVLWPLIDGSVSVGELADDIVAVFDAQRDAVVRDLCQLTGVLLVEGFLEHGEPRPVPRAGGPLPAPPNSCNCGLPGVSWTSATALRIGPHTVGLWSNLPAIDAALRAALPSHVVDDTTIEANLRLVFRAPASATTPPALELYHGVQLAGRSSSSARIRELLGHHLGALATIGTDRLVLAATPYGGPDGVVLVATPLSPSLGFLGPALRRRGLTSGPAVTSLDTVTGDVVVAPSGVTFDPAGTASFDQLCDWTDDEPAMLPAGRYPVLGVALHDDEPPNDLDARDDDDESARRLALVREGIPLVQGLATVGAQPAVDRLLSLAGSIPLRRPGPTALGDWVLDRLDAT